MAFTRIKPPQKRQTHATILPELRGVHTVGHVHAEEDAEDLDDDHQRSDLIVDGPVQEVGGAAGKGDQARNRPAPPRWR